MSDNTQTPYRVSISGKAYFRGLLDTSEFGFYKGKFRFKRCQHGADFTNQAGASVRQMDVIADSHQ